MAASDGPRPYSKKTPLEWARSKGLNCEQDLMAATLQQLCYAQVSRACTNILLAGIFMLILLSRA